MTTQTTQAEFVKLDKESVNGRIQSGFRGGKYKVYGAAVLKEGNSLGLPAKTLSWVSYNRGTKMYSVDLMGQV